LAFECTDDFSGRVCRFTSTLNPGSIRSSAGEFAVLSGDRQKPGEAKKLKMRWSPKGAHLLLQVRTKVLDEELRKKFRHWYLGFEINPEAAKMAVSSPGFLRSPETASHLFDPGQCFLSQKA